ncbi:unnamed protein product [Rotaria socialis]
MTTDVIDEHRFSSQCSLYEPNNHRLSKETKHYATAASTKTLFEASSTPRINHVTRLKQSISPNITANPTNVNNIQNRHSASNDLLSLIRSVAMKPFKTSSTVNTVTEGQTTINAVGGNHVHDKPPVSLLKYRPLSDSVSDRTSYSQSNRETGNFLKRMGWPVNSTTDEARVKWKLAMKFLIPMKFDVDRAINLYRAHETIRKTENLDRIWINNPNLIREIQSNKFFSLRQLPNQPLNVYFTAAQVSNGSSTNSLSQQERELISLQALICQLDVATESVEIQNSGLNFIYDMQSCSASQFDMNLSKKILRLVQGNYPAMVKTIFIVSAPKWFKIAYKVTMHSADQMRDVLITHYGYSLNDLPTSLGGSFDAIIDGDNRYQTCLSTIMDSQSICHSYYSLDYQPVTAKPTSNILFFNTDHYHHNQNQDATSSQTPTASVVSSPSKSLVAIVQLRRNHDLSASSSQIRGRKRESSSSTDSEKRRRSNESLIEEEPPKMRSLIYIPQEISSNQSQHEQASVSNEDAFSSSIGQQENADYSARINTMIENAIHEPNILRRDIKPAFNSPYKPLNSVEFLTKTQSEIRQEFRKLSNPSAKDTHAAKDERNLDKSRYRDVLPGEATRVKLQPDDDGDRNDFINANYVSGYHDQEKAYIFTQGPLQTTLKDFWRMIWQENISIVVMTTNVRESGTVKCYPYWPDQTKDVINAGLYQVQNEKSDKYDSFVITTLVLRKKNHPNERIIYHAHYRKWPDHGIPSNTKDALLFLDKVEDYRQITATKAPILLHCSAGIGRTGTFCAIDIEIKRYLEKKIIDIPSTVYKMRTERAGSVQTEDQYLFAYLALMDYIKQYQAAQERITGSIKSSDTELIDQTGRTKVKDDIGSNELDDHKQKITRSKNNRKKFNDLEQINTLPTTSSDRTTNLRESTSYRGKTLSDSCVAAVQYFTPTAAVMQNESSRQRSVTENISSSTPTTTGNVYHKKIRK